MVARASPGMSGAFGARSAKCDKQVLVRFIAVLIVNILPYPVLGYVLAATLLSISVLMGPISHSHSERLCSAPLPPVISLYPSPASSSPLSPLRRPSLLTASSTAGSAPFHPVVGSSVITLSQCGGGPLAPTGPQTVFARCPGTDSSSVAY